MAVFSVGCGGNSDSGYAFVPVDEVTAIEYTKEAFTYTFPLVYMHLSKVKFTNAPFPTTVAAPVNQICHSDCVGDVNYGQVSNVNRDVVCSQAFLDLGHDAVVFTKPVTDKFCIFELFDAYTNCVTAMGTGTNHDNTKFLITGPRFSGTVPNDMTQIKVPTNLARLIGYIRCESEDDLKNIAEIQKQIDVKEYAIYRSNGRQPNSNFDIRNQFNPFAKLNSLTIEEYFNLANELMVANPPANYDSEIMNRLKRIGVGPGMTFDASILGDSNSYRYFESIKQQCINSEWASKSQMYWFTTSNYNSSVWGFYSSSQLANFGTDFRTDYNYRAFCAYSFVCAHPNSSCLILSKYKDDTDGSTLRGGSKYKLVFQQKRLPPHMPKGFWSITAYNAKTGMIQTDDYNTVFSIINDKSELAENASGTIEISIEPVSESKKNSRRAAHRAAEATDNGSDQGNEPADAEVASATLPIYDTKDNFFLIMRIYLPRDEAINGFWTAPVIKRVEEEEKKKTNN